MELIGDNIGLPIFAIISLSDKYEGLLKRILNYHLLWIVHFKNLNNEKINFTITIHSDYFIITN